MSYSASSDAAFTRQCPQNVHTNMAELSLDRRIFQPYSLRSDLLQSPPFTVVRATLVVTTRRHSTSSLPKVSPVFTGCWKSGPSDRNRNPQNRKRPGTDRVAVRKNKISKP